MIGNEILRDQHGEKIGERQSARHLVEVSVRKAGEGNRPSRFGLR